jgi:hypothetical protein
MMEASQRRRTLIKIRSATAAIKRGISRTCAGRSTCRRSQSLQRITKASKQAGVPLQQLQLMIAKEKSSLMQQVTERNMCIMIMT